MTAPEPRVLAGREAILAAAGETLGTSGWLTVTQEQVNGFADATGDQQWIHVDPERAEADSPYGATIAHGFLVLSLLPVLGQQVYRIADARMSVNYGLNRVRFPSPLPVGAAVRTTAVLTGAEQVSADAIQLVVTHTLERAGDPRPVLVAETIRRVIF